MVITSVISYIKLCVTFKTDLIKTGIDQFSAKVNQIIYKYDICSG